MSSSKYEILILTDGVWILFYQGYHKEAAHKLYQNTCSSQPENSFRLREITTTELKERRV